MTSSGRAASDCSANSAIDLPGAMRVGDMILVGPSGRRALLPALPGIEYPDHAIAISRVAFDNALFEAAVTPGRAGARRVPRTGRRRGCAYGRSAGRRRRAARRRGDRRRRRDQPRRLGGRTGRHPARAVGIRAAQLSGRDGRPAAHPAVGTAALAVVSRLRLDLPDRGRPGQRRASVSRSPPDRSLARQAGEQLGAFCDQLARYGLLPAAPLDRMRRASVAG